MNNIRHFTILVLVSYIVLTDADVPNCTADNYKEGPDGECQPCPANSSAPAGSDAITNCSCNAGSHGQDGGMCLPCEAGKYSGEVGQTVCTVCPKNAMSAVGSSVIADCICLPGTSGANGESCALCIAGTYKTLPGKFDPKSTASVTTSDDCQKFGVNRTLAHFGDISIPSIPSSSSSADDRIIDCIWVIKSDATRSHSFSVITVELTDVIDFKGKLAGPNPPYDITDRIQFYSCVDEQTCSGGRSGQYGPNDGTMLGFVYRKPERAHGTAVPETKQYRPVPRKKGQTNWPTEFFTQAVSKDDHVTYASSTGYIYIRIQFNSKASIHVKWTLSDLPFYTTSTTPVPTTSSSTPPPTTSSTTPQPTTSSTTTPALTTSSSTPPPTTSSTTPPLTTSTTTPAPDCAENTYNIISTQLSFGPCTNKNSNSYCSSVQNWHDNNPHTSGFHSPHSSSTIYPRPHWPCDYYDGGDGGDFKTNDECCICGGGDKELVPTTTYSCQDCPANSSSPSGSNASTACTCNAGYSGPDGGPCIQPTTPLSTTSSTPRVVGTPAPDPCVNYTDVRLALYADRSLLPEDTGPVHYSRDGLSFLFCTTGEIRKWEIVSGSEHTILTDSSIVQGQRLVVSSAGVIYTANSNGIVSFTYNVTNDGYENLLICSFEGVEFLVLVNDERQLIVTADYGKRLYQVNVEKRDGEPVPFSPVFLEFHTMKANAPGGFHGLTAAPDGSFVVFLDREKLKMMIKTGYGFWVNSQVKIINMPDQWLDKKGMAISGNGAYLFVGVSTNGNYALMQFNIPSMTYIWSIIPTSLGRVDNIACSYGAPGTCVLQNIYKNTILNIDGPCMARNPSLPIPDVCGDGLRTGDEQCDVGSNVHNVVTGCDESCDVIWGFTCSDRIDVSGACVTECGDTFDSCVLNCVNDTVQYKDNCSSTCGDGLKAINEGCDDNNTASLDGCDSECKTEAGWYCNIGGQPCLTTCGDRKRAGLEECDDGNVVPGDGCDEVCRNETISDQLANVLCYGDCNCLNAINVHTGTFTRPAKTIGEKNCTWLISSRATIFIYFRKLYFDGDSLAVTINECSDPFCRNPKTHTITTENQPLWEGTGRYASPREYSSSGGYLQVIYKGFSTNPDFDLQAHFYLSDNPTKPPNLLPSTCADTNVTHSLHANAGCEQYGLDKNYNWNAFCLEDNDKFGTCLRCPCACTEACITCGDGRREGLEACDDKNGEDDDGCNGTCYTEAGWNCTGEPTLTSSCVEICGDGRIVGDEACDDGNVDNGDGCDNVCEVEEGWNCSAACEPICGDGLRLGSEACDDGNLLPDDGCNGTCYVEAGWNCTGEPNQTSNCEGICGDGLKAGSEACDDGNVHNGDGCDNDCVVEFGWNCSLACEPICGDGVRLGIEVCDGGDGCTDACTEECGYTCNVSGCVAAECGDGLVAGAETCDDGNEVAYDGCFGCVEEYGYKCNNTVCGESYCIWINGSEVCGDGTILGIEELQKRFSHYCDDGNNISSDGCSSNCTVECGFECAGGSPATADVCNSTCGNGVKTDTEDCDDNNTVSDDGCSDACHIETGYSCEAVEPCGRSICHPVCGDGVLTGTEKCDDNNTFSDDGCSSTCSIECGYTCDAQSQCTTTCGDGVVAGIEECDDNNTVPGDGCNASCVTEPGYSCVDADVCRESSCRAVCGDEIIKVPEEDCDDGNNVSGDGCSSTCSVECGYKCDPECLTTCGDGIRAGVEACDDGNLISGDRCDASCKIEPGSTCANNTCANSTCTCKDDSLFSGHRDRDCNYYSDKEVVNMNDMCMTDDTTYNTCTKCNCACGAKCTENISTDCHEEVHKVITLSNSLITRDRYTCPQIADGSKCLNGYRTAPCFESASTTGCTRTPFFAKDPCIECPCSCGDICNPPTTTTTTAMPVTTPVSVPTATVTADGWYYMDGSYFDGTECGGGWVVKLVIDVPSTESYFYELAAGTVIKQSHFTYYQTMIKEAIAATPLNHQDLFVSITEIQISSTGISVSVQINVKDQNEGIQIANAMTQSDINEQILPPRGNNVFEYPVTVSTKAYIEAIYASNNLYEGGISTGQIEKHFYCFWTIEANTPIEIQFTDNIDSSLDVFVSTNRNSDDQFCPPNFLCENVPCDACTSYQTVTNSIGSIHNHLHSASGTIHLLVQTKNSVSNGIAFTWTQSLTPYLDISNRPQLDQFCGNNGANISNRTQSTATELTDNQKAWARALENENCNYFLNLNHQKYCTAAGTAVGVGIHGQAADNGADVCHSCSCACSCECESSNTSSKCVITPTPTPIRRRALLGNIVSTTQEAVCDQCPPGRSSRAGSTFCFIECAAGKTYNKTNDECEPCPEAFFKNATGPQECVRCPENQTSQLGASHEHCSRSGGCQLGSQTLANCTCLPGYTVSEDGRCVECAAGTYKADYGRYECSICPQHSNSLPGSQTVSACACNAGYKGNIEGKEMLYYDTQYGTYANLRDKPSFYSDQIDTTIEFEEEKCILCPAGKYMNATELCSDNAAWDGEHRLFLYSDSGRMRWQHISKNGYDRSGYGGCAVYAPGKDLYGQCKRDGACGNCSCSCAHECRNTFAEVADAVCSDCDAGKYSVSEGGASSDACNVCPTTTVSVAGSEFCGCAEGFTVSSDGSCIKCGAHSSKKPNEIGNASCMCGPGYTGPDNGFISENGCVACTIGKYKTGYGNKFCTDCPAGEQSLDDAASECTQCPQQSFKEKEGPGSCNPCAPGLWADDVGATTCDCDETLQIGNPKACLCQPGTFGPPGSKQCTQCEAGKYSLYDNSNGCTDCPLGGRTPDNNDYWFPSISIPGSGSPLSCQCPRGTTGTMGGENCSACASGKFTKESGHTLTVYAVCKDPLVDYLTRRYVYSGFSNGKPYYESHGKTTKYIYYFEGWWYVGDSLAQKTATGLKIESAENVPPLKGWSERCSDVWQLGNSGVGVADAGCEDCPANSQSYFQLDGNYKPTHCICIQGHGFYGDAGCVECAAGKYNYVDEYFFKESGMIDRPCMECPIGKYSAVEGSRGPCIACESGKQQPLTGQTSCVVCPPGTYSDLLISTECVQCPTSAGAGLANSVAISDCVCEVGYSNSEGGPFVLDPMPIIIWDMTNDECTPFQHVDLMTCWNNKITSYPADISANYQLRAGSIEDNCYPRMFPGGSSGCFDAITRPQFIELDLDVSLMPRGVSSTKTRSINFVGIPTFLSSPFNLFDVWTSGVERGVTFSFWTKMENPSKVDNLVRTFESAWIMHVGETGNSQDYIRIRRRRLDSFLVFEGKFGGTRHDILYRETKYNVWHHIIWSIEAEKQGWKITVDGIDICNGDGEVSCPSQTTMRRLPGDGISQIMLGGTGLAEQNILGEPVGYFTGQIADFRVYDRVVSLDKIYDYRAPVCVACNGINDDSYNGICSNSHICTMPASNTHRANIEHIHIELEKCVCITGAVSVNDICTCKSGYTAENVSSELKCVKCAANTYKSGPGVQACTNCPENSLTISNGSISPTSCVCKEGAYKKSEVGCVKCDKNTYKSSIGNEACTNCRENSFTISRGSISSTSCVCKAGAYEVSEVGCVKCARDTFKPKSGPHACTNCNVTYITISEGSIPQTSCVCKAGEYAVSEVGCVECALNTFKSSTGVEACTKCPATGFTTEKGSTSCVCDTGAYLTKVGSELDCNKCALNTFKSAVGAQECTKCPVNSFAREEGSTSCVCAPGNSPVNKDANEGCSPCVGNSYTADFGTSECIECPKPKIVQNHGCICPPGVPVRADGTCSLGGITITTVEVTVVLLVIYVPFTVQEFGDEKQTQFKTAIAATANVDDEFVLITDITPNAVSTIRRRMLTSGVSVGTQITITDGSKATSVVGRMTLSNINTHMVSSGIGTVTVSKEASVGTITEVQGSVLTEIPDSGGLKSTHSPLSWLHVAVLCIACMLANK